MINKSILVFYYVLCFNLIYSQTYNDSLLSGKNFNKAAFRMWIPEDLGSMQGILIIMPGYEGDGRGAVADSFWQSVARKFQFALLGCYFTNYPGDDLYERNYCNVKEGSGTALVNAINNLAVKSSHPELKYVPFFMWGHSAGGQFNYEFACWKSDRIIGFVVNKGGYYFSGLAPKETRNTPGLFIIGDEDYDYRKNSVKAIFTMNRKLGAFWTFASEPEQAHGVGKTQKLAIAFFEEIMPLRMKKPFSADSTFNKLSDISIEDSFFGDINKHTYASYTIWDKDLNQFNTWLPSIKFANAWLQFLSPKSVK